MAKYVVPPRDLSTEIILKCLKCKCLYVPEGKAKSGYLSPIDYEKCPVCGYEHNGTAERIPLWRYNLIKWLRGGFKKDGEHE